MQMADPLGRQLDAIDRARRLDLGVFQRLAAFARDQHREVVGLPAHQLGQALQDLDPAVCRQPAIVVTVRRGSTRQHRVGLVPRRVAHFVDYGAVKGLFDGKAVGGVHLGCSG